ncbi:MAG: hypothetical protein KF777_06235 [Planctomycetaceae bacterium]|nr:hypothetical protein [Planctomycetaceae bacterium]
MRRLLDKASPMPRRRGSTAKTILIVLGILGGVAFVSCLGIGVAGYYFFKKTLGEMAVTDEPGIRKIVGEMADITVPPEFAPQMASSVFGIRNVFFKWCPDKNCPPLSLDANNADADGPDAEQPGTLMLTSIATDPDDPPAVVNEDAAMEENFFLENLDEEFADYTVEKLPRTIGGRNCTFFIVHGRRRTFEERGEAEAMESKTPGEASDVTGAEPVATEAESPETLVDNTTKTPAPETPAGPKLYWVHGEFPGKSGSVTLELHLLEDQYNAEVVKALIESIR